MIVDKIIEDSSEVKIDKINEINHLIFQNIIE